MDQDIFGGKRKSESKINETVDNRLRETIAVSAAAAATSEPVEQRWEESAGMYTHKKFKKMASSVVVSTSSPTPMTSSVVPSVIASSAVVAAVKMSSSAQSPSPKSFPPPHSASTLKHGVMSLIDSNSVSAAASVTQHLTQPQHALTSQQLNHSAAATSHLPSRQVVSTSLSTKVNMNQSQERTPIILTNEIADIKLKNKTSNLIDKKIILSDSKEKTVFQSSYTLVGIAPI